MKTSKLFLLLGIICIFVSSILTLFWLRHLDNGIKQIESKIEFLQEQMSIREKNLNRFSEEAVKGTTNYGFYYILKELNSSKITDFDGKFKNSLVNSIGILTEGNLSRAYLNKKSVPDLNDIALKKLDEYIDIQNKGIDKLSELKKEKDDKVSFRDNWLLVVGIIQSLSLVFWIVAQFIER